MNEMNTNYVADTAPFIGGEDLIPMKTTSMIQPFDFNRVGKQVFRQLSKDAKESIVDMCKDNAPVSKVFSRYAADDIANEGLYFARALEYFTSQIFMVQYEELPYRKVFKVSNEGYPGINWITSGVIDRFGQARPIGHGADQSIPFVEVGAKEIRYPVIEFGIGARWTIQELEAFAVARRHQESIQYSPETLRQWAAIRAMDEALNKQVFYGLPENNTYGLLNHPSIPISPAVVGASGSTNWEQKTADEILYDLNNLLNGIYTNTKLIEKPNRLLLPASKKLLLLNRRIEYRQTSILTYFLENNQFINSADAIIGLNELEGAGFDGTGKMIAYNDNAMKARIAIPQEMTPIPVQMQGFYFVMLWHARSAGLIVTFPNSMSIVEGI